MSKGLEVHIGGHERLAALCPLFIRPAEAEPIELVWPVVRFGGLVYVIEWRPDACPSWNDCAVLEGELLFRVALCCHCASG